MSSPTQERPLRYLEEMAEGGYSAAEIGPFHRRMVPWLLARHGIPREAVVVDIGAGQGHGLIPLHQNGWHNLVAVDIDDYCFEALSSRHGIRCIRADMGIDDLALPDGSVSAVLAFHVIEHLEDPSNLLRQCHRILEENGCLFLVTPDWRKQYKTFYRDPTHVRPYDSHGLARLLRLHGFTADVGSWKTAFGLGRVQAYRWWPRLGMIGSDLMAVARPE